MMPNKKKKKIQKQKVGFERREKKRKEQKTKKKNILNFQRNEKRQMMAVGIMPLAFAAESCRRIL